MAIDANRLNKDLKILMEFYDKKDSLGNVICPGVEWNNDPTDRWIKVLGIKLPQNCHPRETNVKIIPIVVNPTIIS